MLLHQIAHEGAVGAYEYRDARAAVRIEYDLGRRRNGFERVTPLKYGLGFAESPILGHFLGVSQCASDAEQARAFEKIHVHRWIWKALRLKPVHAMAMRATQDL